ncbi:MAG: sigma-70 family RNA polymerase sigma factor [Actinobacteria bacterium]|nr:sigma-70 family RNA polymerase sigma factor [Actinomycetota bacterium]
MAIEAPLRTWSDETLLREVAVEDDVAAFAAIYGRYWARAMRVVEVICPREGFDSDRVVLKAFAVAWSERHSFIEDTIRPQAWLFSIVRDVAMSWCGDAEIEKNDRAASPLVGFLRAFEDEAEAGGSADESAAVESIVHAMRSLAPKQRELVALSFFGELTPEEVSDLLRIPVNSVRERMRFGRMPEA